MKRVKAWISINPFFIQLSMKPTRRKGFNFYRSYYDVFNKLPTDKDKLEFISILLDKQFLDADPIDCSMIVEFAYESQLHSITKQVKGWKDATSLKITDPQSTPQGVAASIPKAGTPKEVQEKEKEKEEVKEEKVYSDEIKNFTQSLLNYFPIEHKDLKKVYKDIELLIKKDGYNETQILKIITHFRSDDFWSKNFQSLLKLRKSNKEGIKYIDYFNQQLKINTNGNKQTKKPTNAADRGNGFVTDWDEAERAAKLPRANRN